MSTIMKQGKLRCDATCHTAHGSKCTCICGGRYHGSSVRADMLEQRREIEDVVLRKTLVENAQRTLEFVNEVPLDFGE